MNTPVYPNWPPPPVAPHKPPRRWPTIAAAIGITAVAVAGLTTLITVNATTPTPAPQQAAQTVTVTASPPESTTPAALPAAQADSQTCKAWQATNTLVTAAAVAQSIIPPNLTITSPEVRANPEWSEGVSRASKLYQQASDNLAKNIAAGTSPMLQHIADTTVSSLHTLSIAYDTYDPANGNVTETFRANRDALDAICP